MLSITKFHLTFLVLLFFGLGTLSGQIKEQNLIKQDVLTNVKAKTTPFLQGAQYDAQKKNLPFYRHYTVLEGSSTPLLQARRYGYT